MEIPNDVKNAVIYCRVSTKEQVEEGNSLVTQEKHCREYAAKHNYIISNVFIEQGESAKTADRTELRKLLSFCAVKKNNIQAIIIYKIDRLSRNIDDYSQIRLNLKRYGVEIKSTSEFFENSPAGRFMENILANVAQFDNDVRTERCVGGLKQAIQEGRYVWPAPIGYSNVKINGKANIAPNEKAIGVQKAFQDVAKGLYSVNEARLKIASIGLVQRDGKPLAKSRFYHLLKNEIYTGYITKFGMRIKGNFEPLISDALFQQVQRRIKSKKVSRTYLVENPDFPLRRFITGPSGEKLTGSWSQGKSKKYPYYRFLQSKKEFRKSDLEEKFISFLSRYAISEQLFKRLKEKVYRTVRGSSDTIQLVLNDLERKKEQLRRKKQLLIDKSLSGIISDSILKEQLSLIEEEIWETEELISGSKGNSTSAPELLGRLKEFFIDPGRFWEKQPFYIKKKIQQFEFPKGIVFDGNEFRTPEITSIFKLNHFFLANKFSNVDHPEHSYKHRFSTNSSPFSSEELMAVLGEIEPKLAELDTIMNSREEEADSIRQR